MTCRELRFKQVELADSPATGKHRPDRRLRRGDKLVNVLLGVSKRKVVALQLDRNLEDSVLKQLEAVGDEELIIVSKQVRECRNRGLKKIRNPDRPEAGNYRRDAQRLEEFSELFPDLLSKGKNVFVDGLIGQLLDGGKRGCDCRGVPIERACVEHRITRRRAEHLHEVAATADGRDGIAVGHRLADRRQIRRYPRNRLKAAKRVPEPRDHLVEDQHRIVPVAEVAETFKESRFGQHASDVVGDRLEDDGRDLSWVLFESRASCR